MKPFTIDPDIRKASTLPAEVYRDPAYYELQREHVFARSWQLVLRGERLAEPASVLPFTLLEGCLDEPLLLTRDEGGRLHGVSNVCTHRGNLVVAGDGPLRARTLRCRYHGRRFQLDGRFVSMPEFEDAEAFPSEADDLARVHLASWGPFVFASLDPEESFDRLIEPVRRRTDWMPLERFAFDGTSSRDYEVRANWALYCDNYLEGFHIPYVHPALSDEIDYGSYRTETYDSASLQVALAQGSEAAFELPQSHPDHGQAVVGYYFWLFPNTMLNFYPWGLSVNVVQPQGHDRTRVSFLSYVWDQSKRSRGAGAELHRVEMEDEEVVEAVQRGMRSRLYQRGRYSPAREACVHHFHRLLARSLWG
jgi:choline monooxygenase